jgi:ribosome-associated toxin RatA of RatAB toxin-antitoxin module
MRTVSVTATAAGLDPDDAFERVADFEHYPQVCETVLSVTQEHLDGERTRSTWEVQFRDGVMEWTEEDHLDRRARTIAFTQTVGDFEHFSGRWAIRPEGSGSVIEFRAEFDLGVPSLGNLLEPIAERSLRENVAAILRSLLGERVRVESGPDVGARADD